MWPFDRSAANKVGDLQDGKKSRAGFKLAEAKLGCPQRENKEET